MKNIITNRKLIKISKVKNLLHNQLEKSSSLIFKIKYFALSALKDRLKLFNIIYMVDMLKRKLF